jgi:dihydroorotate dehydrogenase
MPSVKVLLTSHPGMYKFFRNILFIFPAEWIHYFSMNCLKIVCSIGFLKKLLSANLKPRVTNQYSIFNLQFKNRIGLGAGFDKNAKYLRELEALGFGFIEIGTVTPLPQKGNPKPRLFRLPKDKALINRMGFNNDGVNLIAKRLKDGKKKKTNSRVIIGGNIGKNKNTPNEDAWKDYEICFKELHPYVDYFVVNVSSPNTPGLRELQEKESLKKILTHLQTINQQPEAGPKGLLRSNQKPILLKIAPDLTNEQLDDVIDLAIEIKLDGIVATNTTTSRDGLTTHDSRLTKIGAGGLSGMPVQKRSTEIIKYIHQKTNGQIPIIASGGIFRAEDVKEKLDAGASLLQVWTGFIYEGPSIVKKIYKSL